MKRFYFGNQWFLPPFSTKNYWVDDATGKSVAEAATPQLAEALARMLNNAAKEVLSKI